MKHLKKTQDDYNVHFLPTDRNRLTQAVFWSLIFSVFWLLCRYFPIFLFGAVQNHVSGTAVAAALLSGVLLEALRRAGACLLRRTFLGKWGTGILLTAVFAGLSLYGQAWTDSPFALALQLLAALGGSGVLTVLSMSGGLLPALFYRCLTFCLPLVIPIEANMPERLALLMQTLLPVLFLVILDCDLSDAPPEKERSEGRKPNLWRRLLWLLPVGCFCLLIAFFRGLLPWIPTAIATGSMTPELQVGDIVIVSTLERDSVQAGDIIQFQRDGLSVVHRIVEVSEEDGITVYITKGDANNANDAGSVSPSDVDGKVVAVLPSLGMFPLWLHSQDE